MTRRMLTLVLPALLLAVSCAPAAPAPPKATESKPAEAAKPAATAAPAAQPAAASKAAGAKGTATVVQGPEIRSLDGTVEVALPILNAVMHLYDPLLTRDEKLQPVPHLASAFSVEDGGTRIRLTLRSGVKFHDGSAFSADDVKYTLDRVRDPATKSSHMKFVSAIKEVSVVDPQTVDLQLTKYDATLPGRLTMIPMVSKAHTTAKGAETLVSEPMGTGPWKLKEWVRGQQMVLEANPDYWGEPPKIQTIIWKSLPEATTRAAAAQTGAADVVISVPPHLSDQVKSGGKAEVQYVHGLRNFWINLNAYKKPYDDVRVRRALNHAVNVDLYIKSILGGRAARTAGPIGPNVFGYNSNIKPYEYDPEKARALLTEAGYPNGFEASMMFVTDGQIVGEPEIVQAVVADLAKVGVKVTLSPTEFNTYVQKWVQVLNTETDLFTHSNANNTADADFNLTTNVYSKGRGQERTGFYWPTPADVDEAIIQGRSIVDVQEREKLYHRVMERIHEEAPFIFMFDQFDSYAVSKRLQNFKPRPDEFVLLHKASLAE